MRGSERILELDDQPVRLLDAREAGDDAPVLYVHGVPESADLWHAFQERTGGVAVDLPGFGRSGKRADLDYTLAGYARWLPRLLDRLEIGRVRLVVHDWGAAALAWAQAEPERVERLVVVDAVPLLPGYEWHRLARAWRTPVVGELAMGVTFRWTVRRLAPPEVAERVWAGWDQGTQRAILRLYRAADPERLAEAGARLGEIDAPALVVWGEDDPYIPARFAAAYAEALGSARAEVVPEAGHWPWLDDPSVVDRVVAFLDVRGA